MTQSRYMTLESVYTHPGVLATTSVLLFAMLAPVAWYLAFAYFVLALLDQALTKYHLYGFTPLTPPSASRSSRAGRPASAARARSTRRSVSSWRWTLGGVEMLTLLADLSSADGIQSVIDFAKQRALVVDILINNAFVTRNSIVINLGAEEVDAVLTLNVLAVTRLSHFFARAMATRGIGHVLNVVSTAAFIAMPTAAIYSSTKSYMLGLSVAMNYELRGTDVSVTCFCPGPMNTNFSGSGNYLCAKGPGMLLDATACARNGPQGLFEADAYLHDTLGRVVLSMRLRALVGAVMMNEPNKIFAMRTR